MCTVCGCGAGETKIEGEGHAHEHVHADGTVHSHAHGHDHDHHHEHGAAAAAAHEHSHHHADGTVHSHPHVHQGEHVHEHAHAHGIGGDLDFGAGPARAHAPGLSQSRMVQIEQDILAKNNTYADANRRAFDERGIFALNLVSSPGSGKTTLLVKTIALQINTGKGCHLDGHMVGHAIERLKPADGSLFLIENVGNLVCPAAFDLGEHHKVAILSVTEGEDKPLKYPDMFRAADVMLLNKCDLLPHLDFDADLAEANARRVNPDLTVFRVSATRGEGMSAWVDWITAGLVAQGARRAESVDALKARIAELERQLAAR